MYHLTLSPSLTSTSTPHRRHLPTFTHTFSKTDPSFLSFLSFPPRASALVVPISWTVSSSCIETKDIVIFLAQKIYYYLHYTSLYLPIFIQWYLSTCVSERQNPLVNKKKIPQCNIIHVYHMSLPIPALGGAHEDLDTIKLFRKT